MRKQLATLVVALFIAFIFTGCNNGSGGDNSGPAVSKDTGPIEIESVFGDEIKPREVPHNGVELISIRITAREPVTIDSLTVETQEVTTGIVGYAYVYNPGVIGEPLFGDNPESLHQVKITNSGIGNVANLTHIGDHTVIPLQTYFQEKKDNELFTTRLVSVKGRTDDGMPFEVFPQGIEETVLIEEGNEGVVYRSNQLRTTVPVGASNAEFARLRLENYSQKYSNSIQVVVVERVTPNDNSTIRLVVNGIVIAEGNNTSVHDVNQQVRHISYILVHPPSLTEAIPGGNSEVSLEVDLSQTSLMQTQYRIDRLSLSSSNGQIRNQNGWSDIFTVIQQ